MFSGNPSIIVTRVGHKFKVKQPRPGGGRIWQTSLCHESLPPSSHQSRPHLLDKQTSIQFKLRFWQFWIFIFHHLLVRWTVDLNPQDEIKIQFWFYPFSDKYYNKNQNYGGQIALEMSKRILIEMQDISIFLSRVFLTWWLAL